MSQNGQKCHVVLKTIKKSYPELVSILKKMKIMKTLNFEKTENIFAGFILSNEEMINVRGGDADGNPIPVPPVIKI